MFIDFENCALGPIEFDLAWVPHEVSGSCRGATRISSTSAGASCWHWSPHTADVGNDQHPSGRDSGVAFLDLVRAGPLWSALDEVTW